MSRFENINLLRAFAALTVVVYHVVELDHWSLFPVHGPLLVFRIGWIGVDLFFVISGFVISYSAILLYRKNPQDFIRHYWLRRLTRIVPLYLLTMAVWIAVLDPAFFSRGIRSWASQLTVHAAFVHNFSPRTFSAINGVNWTLAVEMQFYLAIAVLIRWIERTPGWRIWASCVIVAWVWRGAMVLLQPHADTYHMFIAVSQLPGQLDEFGAGIFLAKLVLAEHPRRTIESVGWLTGACVFGYLSMAIYWPYASYWDMPWMIVFWRSSLALCLLCVVALAIWLPQSISTRWLRPVHYLGEISYGIYLWQLVAVSLAMSMVVGSPSKVLVLTLVFVIAMSIVSWQLFERPIMSIARAAHRISSGERMSMGGHRVG